MFTKYENGAEVEIEVVARYDATAGVEVEAEGVYRYDPTVGAEVEVWSGAEKATAYFMNGTRTPQVSNNTIFIPPGETDWLCVFSDESISGNATVSFNYEGYAYIEGNPVEVGRIQVGYLNVNNLGQLLSSTVTVIGGTGPSKGACNATIPASISHSKVGFMMQVPSSSYYANTFEGWITISNFMINGKKYKIK